MADTALSTAPKSGDGATKNFGVVLSCNHDCGDCHQEFESAETDIIHEKCIDSQQCEKKSHDTCGGMPCGDEHMTSVESRTQSEEPCAMEKECTICMESINEVTILPCQCKLHYCRSCWDTALANSFSQCGQARCPSCRAPVRVDFDPDRNCLVFTPETVDMTYSSQRELLQRIQQEYESQLSGPPSEESFRQFLQAHAQFELLTNLDRMRQGTVEKLRHQAMPAQIKILKQFGEDNPSLKHIAGHPSNVLAKASVGELKKIMNTANVSAHGCLEKSELVGRLAEGANADILQCIWASQKCPAPSCVCGSFLQRIGGIDRFKDSLGDRANGLSDEEIQRRARQLQSKGGGVVICDICEKNVPLIDGSFVWTCANRNSTIMHATSYDICDECFVHSTCL